VARTIRSSSGPVNNPAWQKNLYPSDFHDFFNFLDSPLSAVLLAMLSWFGKIPLCACLSFMNAVAWWMCNVCFAGENLVGVN
jgi:hypothetical protein